MWTPLLLGIQSRLLPGFSLSPPRSSKHSSFGDIAFLPCFLPCITSPSFLVFMVKTPSNSSILSFQGLFPPSPLSKLHLPGEFFPGRGENVGSGVGSKSKLGTWSTGDHPSTEATLELLPTSRRKFYRSINVWTCKVYSTVGGENEKKYNSHLPFLR